MKPEAMGGSSGNIAVETPPRVWEEFFRASIKPGDTAQSLLKSGHKYQTANRGSELNLLRSAKRGTACPKCLTTSSQR